MFFPIVTTLFDHNGRWITTSSRCPEYVLKQHHARASACASCVCCASWVGLVDALADRVQVLLPAENEGTPGGSGCGRTQGTAGWLPRLPPPTPEQMAKLNALATQRLQAGRRRVVLRYYPKPRDSNARRRVVVVRRTPSEETTQTDSGGRVVVCRGWSETKPVEVQPDV